MSGELPEVSCSRIWLRVGAESCCWVRNRLGKGARRGGAKPAAPLRVLPAAAGAGLLLPAPPCGVARPFPKEGQSPWEAVVLCQPLQTPVQQLLVPQGRLCAEPNSAGSSPRYLQNPVSAPSTSSTPQHGTWSLASYLKHCLLATRHLSPCRSGPGGCFPQAPFYISGLCLGCRRGWGLWQAAASSSSTPSVLAVGFTGLFLPPRVRQRGFSPIP